MMIFHLTNRNKRTIINDYHYSKKKFYEVKLKVKVSGKKENTLLQMKVRSS